VRERRRVEAEPAQQCTAKKLNEIEGKFEEMNMKTDRGTWVCNPEPMGGGGVRTREEKKGTDRREASEIEVHERNKNKQIDKKRGATT
jgi:hypothetical protein